MQEGAKKSKLCSDVPGFEVLPVELILKWMGYLSGPQLCQLAQVCKKFNVLSEHDSFWCDIAPTKGMPITWGCDLQKSMKEKCKEFLAQDCVDFCKSFPVKLIEILQKYGKISAIPILDVNRYGLHSPALISPEMLKGHKMMRGKMDNMHFITFCVKENTDHAEDGEIKPKLFVLTVIKNFSNMTLMTTSYEKASMVVGQKVIEYLSRLINDNPCGVFGYGIEGPKTTKANQSVMQLTTQMEFDLVESMQKLSI